MLKSNFIYILLCYCLIIYRNIGIFHIDTVEVVGSNPIVPTMMIKGLQN